jgi:tetratricopeptide (TPR) repeat protein
VQGLAEGLALRRFSDTVGGRAFGEYWIARALYEAKLYHLAWNGMSKVASAVPAPETQLTQTAALDCLNQLQSEFPAMTLSSETMAHFEELPPSEGRSIAGASYVRSLLSSLSENTRLEPEIIRAVNALKHGNPAYYNFANGLYLTAQAGHSRLLHRQAIESLEKFLNEPMPADLKEYVDSVHLDLARSYYTIGEFPEAQKHLKLISKSSNELAEALTELSWAFLQDERYPEAIGTAMNLQAGGLRHTFAPEAPMVMAMALNEICQYPESVKAVNHFKKLYDKSYRWLASWNPEQGLYSKAVQFIKGKSDVPDRVASEWVRSPMFIATQTEINLIFTEKSISGDLSKSGAIEQRKIAEDLLARVIDLRPRIKIAKMKLHAGEKLPSGILSDLAVLKDRMTQFRRMQQAAPIWKAILANYQAKLPALEGGLVARIDHDLKQRTEEMRVQLEEIAENNQLIEVEIYNGASEDIIWQNAHPDYKKIVKTMKEDAQRTIASKTWNWGAPVTDENGDDGEEIWEDELGSFKANLFDNCSSKDRYLAVRNKLAAK